MPAANPAENDVLRIVYMLVDDAAKWERNPKKHDEPGIWESICLHGFKDPPKFEPALNGGAGGIAEGNGRSHVLKLHQGKEAAPRGIMVADDGRWLMPVLFGVDSESEAAAEAYAVDHNNLTLAGADPLLIPDFYDEDAYRQVLAGLSEADLLPVSVDLDDLKAMLDPDAAGDGEKRETSDGSLLELANVAIKEPDHVVESGDVWHMGDHVLVCAEVLTDWEQWKGYLKGEVVFLPYPGPFAVLTKQAAETPLLLVQPDPYIAGHILDQWDAIKGAGNAAKKG